MGSVQDAAARERRQPSRQQQLIEVSVFLFLIVPSMALSFFAFKQGSLDFVIVASATILRDLALVSLILYFTWRNGEPVRALGWRFENARSEIYLGIVLFFPLFFGAGMLDALLRQAGFSSPATPPHSLIPANTTPDFLLASFLVAVVALAEETIFRGYLILRFRALSGSAAAVVLSAAIFSLGHGYEGSAGVLTVGAMGAAFAVVYLWRGSLVAPIVMHFLQDFVSIALLPLFGGK